MLIYMTFILVVPCCYCDRGQRAIDIDSGMKNIAELLGLLPNIDLII